MPKSTTMTKYTDSEANYISLVGRGANQIPLKIVKQDKGDTQMFNLTNLMKKITKGAVDPVSIVAVATNKDPALLSPLLEEAGLEPTKITKSAKDGNLIAFGEIENEADVHAVQVSPDLTVIVKGFTPWAEDLVGSATFSELVKTEAFFANVYDASDSLSTVIRTTMYNAGDKVEAKEEIAKVLAAYSDYVLSLIDGLPIIAFKMDKALTEAEQQAQAEVQAGAAPTEAPTEDPVDPAPVVDAPVEPEAEKEPTEDPEPTPSDAAPVDETQPIAQEPAPVQKSAEPVPAFDMTAFATAMATALQPLADKLDTVIQKADKADTEVEDLKQTVQKQADVLSTTVKTQVTKSDSAVDTEVQENAFAGTGCIDTAVSRPSLKA